MRQRYPLGELRFGIEQLLGIPTFTQHTLFGRPFGCAAPPPQQPPPSPPSLGGVQPQSHSVGVGAEGVVVFAKSAPLAQIAGRGMHVDQGDLRLAVQRPTASDVSVGTDLMAWVAEQRGWGQWAATWHSSPSTLDGSAGGTLCIAVGCDTASKTPEEIFRSRLLLSEARAGGLHVFPAGVTPHGAIAAAAEPAAGPHYATPQRAAAAPGLVARCVAMEIALGGTPPVEGASVGARITALEVLLEIAVAPDGRSLSGRLGGVEQVAAANGVLFPLH